MAQEQRKLAAIVLADVVGYSRLVGVDEARTIRDLRRHRSDFIRDSSPRRFGPAAPTVRNSKTAPIDLDPDRMDNLLKAHF